MRDNILKCFGRFPEKIDLDTKELERDEGDGYIRYLIEYNVEERK